MPTPQPTRCVDQPDGPGTRSPIGSQYLQPPRVPQLPKAAFFQLIDEVQVGEPPVRGERGKNRGMEKGIGKTE